MKFRRLRQALGLTLITFAAIFLIGMIYIAFTTSLEYILKFILYATESENLKLVITASVFITAFGLKNIWSKK